MSKLSAVEVLAGLMINAGVANPNMNETDIARFLAPQLAGASVAVVPVEPSEEMRRLGEAGPRPEDFDYPAHWRKHSAPGWPRLTIVRVIITESPHG